MSERFYPHGIWCVLYCMWADDVVDLTDSQNECNGDCKNCEYSKSTEENE